MRGAFVSVAAILLGFVLFWFVLVDLLDNGGGTFSADWLVLGDVSITWGAIVDSLSVTMIGLVTFVALLVQVYSIEYMRGEPRYGWYFASHALFAAAMLALVLADNLVFLYLAWELVGLGSYLLIGFWHEKRSAAEAAKKAFVTTRIGDVGLLIGIILLYRATGTFDISGVIHAVENGVGTGLISQATVNLAMFLVFLGAMGKSAQFPFHVWLPDAMEGPTPVSALIHAATMVAAGVFLVARLMPLFEMAPAVLLFVAVIGLITFAFAGTLALVMTDLKRVLAYSTISHLGLMMLSLGAFGMAVAIFHLLVHGIAKALLFLGAGSVTHGTGRTDIREMGGLRRAMPVTAITFTIGAASLAGLVPFSGFFSKEEALITVLDERGLALFIPTFAAAPAERAIHGEGYLPRLLRREPGRGRAPRVPLAHDGAPRCSRAPRACAGHRNLPGVWRLPRRQGRPYLPRMARRSVGRVGGRDHRGKLDYARGPPPRGSRARPGTPTRRTRRFTRRQDGPPASGPRRTASWSTSTTWTRRISGPSTGYSSRSAGWSPCSTA